MLNLVVTSANLGAVKRKVVASSLSAAQKHSFMDMLRQHQAKPAALNGKTVGEMIVEQHAYVMALRMTAAARAADRRHRAQMAALIFVAAATGNSDDRSLVLNFAVQNKTGKAIAALDCAIEVHAASGKRLGIAEFELKRTVAPHATAHFSYNLPYVKFGGDARDVRNARGKRLSIFLDVKEIAYSSGATAGSGD